MRHLIIVCNLEDLDHKELRTSSSKYELSFAQELSLHVDKVSILSNKLKENTNYDNIYTHVCDSGDLTYKVKPFARKIKQILDENDDSVILFWGYNPVVIRELSKLRSNRTKVVSMVYDTHIGTLSNKSALKRILIKGFYNFGMKQINKLDGVLLFKQSAIKYLNLNIKSCVILPFLKIDSCLPYTKTSNNNLTFLYSGTLCEYNGIEELLNAFTEMHMQDIYLKIYGDGPLEAKVKTIAEEHSNIYYGGRISNEQLSKEVINADVLINCRKVPSIVNDFAFPSKIVEYMSYGKVVVSTNVSENPEFQEAVYLLENIEKTEITRTLEYIANHTDQYENKVEKSKYYLADFHDNKTISVKVFNFLFNELFL